MYEERIASPVITKRPRSAPSTGLFELQCVERGAGRERLDLVAVVRDAQRVAAQPQRGLEMPAPGLVADRVLARHRRHRAGGVAMLALDVPGAFLEQEGVRH